MIDSYTRVTFTFTLRENRCKNRRRRCRDIVREVTFIETVFDDSKGVVECSIEKEGSSVSRKENETLTLPR